VSKWKPSIPRGPDEGIDIEALEAALFDAPVEPATRRQIDFIKDLADRLDWDEWQVMQEASGDGVIRYPKGASIQDLDKNAASLIINWLKEML
jgi:hypothetical protein